MRPNSNAPLAVRGYVADDGSLWSHDSELHGAGASHIRVPLVSLRDTEREIAVRDARITELEAEVARVRGLIALRRAFIGDVAQCGCRWSSDSDFGDVLELCDTHKEGAMLVLRKKADNETSP